MSLYSVIITITIAMYLEFYHPSSSAFSKATGAPEPAAGGEATLNFLEANPYYDQTNIPLQTFKAATPHIGKVVSVKRVVGPNAVGETCDIIIDHGGKMPYWEGQSYGVIPPGQLTFFTSTFIYICALCDRESSYVLKSISGKSMNE
jgi:hypothetical protein